MLEQTDLNKAGDLMKEMIKGIKEFFNINGQGNTDQTGQESRRLSE